MSRAKHELSLQQFTDWLNGIQEQPPWRSRADREMEYYDGNQLDAAVLQAQKEKGIPPAIEPLIGPSIDSILGMESKNRTDWRVIPDTKDNSGDEVAEAQNLKLSQAERHSKADRACSDAYKSQISVGIGWVEVARNSDPFGYPYRCRSIHRNEMYWDFLSVEHDLSDARYIVRRKWTDAKIAELMFPDKSDLLKQSSTGWRGVDMGELITTDGGTSTDLAMSMEMERGWSIEEQQWRDVEQGRVCLFEVWYRVWERAKVIKTPDSRVVEYDKSNPAHVLACKCGIETQDALITRMRVAIWCGPHKLSDNPSPYPHNNFPYIPFWGKREDRTGVPYGLIRGQMFLQDEVNARVSKMQWLLSSYRVTRTDGAVAYPDEVFRQVVARPDADIILNPDAMARAGAVFKVDRDAELNRQQYERLMDAREGIKRAAGVTDAFSGVDNRGQSGAALGTLVEQSIQGLADINDNFAFARAEVGDLLLSLIIEDTPENEVITITGNPIKGDKQITLNSPAIDPDTGMKYLTNDVQRVKLKVTLSEVPSTPSFRVQQLSSMTEAFKSMPTQYQAAALPHLLTLMDIPDKDDIIETVKRLSEQASPEQIEQQVKEAVEQALMKAQIELKTRELDMKEKVQIAEIEKIISEKVNKRIESIYSATQAGAQIMSMPGVAPVADQILKSADFQDADVPPIVAQGGPMMPPISNHDMQAGMMAQPEVQQNTSPMFPPRVQEPDLTPPDEPMATPMMEQGPGAGMAQGIEAPGVQV